MKTKIICGVMALVLVGSFLYVSFSKAQGDALERILQIAGTIIGNDLSEKISDELGLIEDVFSIGSAGDINTTMRKDEMGIDRTTSTMVSLYNEDSRDRIITGVYGYFENLDEVTSSPLTIQAATSSSAISAYDQNLNYIFNENACATAGYCDIATSSKYTQFASSTPETTGYLYTKSDNTGIFIWPSETYINWFVYATITPTNLATITLTGLFGVEYWEDK